MQKLVVNLYDDNDKNQLFTNMKKYFKDDMDVMCRKGFYPYEWMDDADKFNHIGLPDIKEFYNNLKQEALSDSDYKHATEVYDRLKCKSFKDFHMAYLKSDVLMLADVFENFRTTCKNYYDLDPANYISVPSFAWDAMLKMTKTELELIHDYKIGYNRKAEARGARVRWK